jgi:glycosyltransferase involved in cell wall biosynthesis
MISIIVPVYNTEKYLDRCIQSILAQTYNDFELLLIDDGSTDSSRAICDKYAEQDSRVRVFHKANGEETNVRRLDVKNALGKFGLFVNCDDELYIISTVEKVIDNTIDIVDSYLKYEALMSGDEYIKMTLYGKLRNSFLYAFA